MHDLLRIVKLQKIMGFQGMQSSGSTNLRIGLKFRMQTEEKLPRLSKLFEDYKSNGLNQTPQRPFALARIQSSYLST